MAATKRGLLYCPDLMYCSKLTSVSRPADQQLDVAYSAEQFADALAADHVYDYALIDLEAVKDCLSDIVRTIQDQSSRTVVLGFGPHVHTGMLAEAESSGFSRVLSRGELFRGAAGIFQQLNG